MMSGAPSRTGRSKRGSISCGGENHSEICCDRCRGIKHQRAGAGVALRSTGMNTILGEDGKRRREIVNEGVWTH